MAGTVNGYTSRDAHIKALMAQGMTERAARIAEMRAFVAEAIRRRKAAVAKAEAGR